MNVSNEVIENNDEKKVDQLTQDGPEAYDIASRNSLHMTESNLSNDGKHSNLV